MEEWKWMDCEWIVGWIEGDLYSLRVFEDRRYTFLDGIGIELIDSPSSGIRFLLN